MTASYVFGKGRSGLEVGGGATIFFFPHADPNEPLVQRFAELITIGKGIGPVALASGRLGYRHENSSGSVFRVTFTPYFGSDHALAWFGLSLGGAF